MAATDNSYWPTGFQVPSAGSLCGGAPPKGIAPATVGADGKLHLGGLAAHLVGDLPTAWTPRRDGDWLVLAAGGDEMGLTTRWDERGPVSYPYLRLTRAHPVVPEVLEPLGERGSARRSFAVERMVAPTELWLRLLWRA